jgi:phage terminase large subunit
MYPGNYILIGRKFYPDLRDTTMDVFFREALPDKLNPKVGDPRTPGKCQWNAGSNTLRFPNGSIIIFRHMEDPRRYLSLNLGAFFLDEAIELGMDYAHKILSSRLRKTNSARRSGICSNPGPKSCWINRKYTRGMQLQPKRFYIVHSSSIENKYLPQDYLEELMDYPDEEFKMYVMGQFIAAEGAIFPKFNRGIHVVAPQPIPIEWPKFRGFDIGIDHPFVCLWAALDQAENKLYIYREWVARGMDLEDNCDVVKDLSEGEAYVHNVIDPSTRARAVTGGVPIIQQVNDHLGTNCLIGEGDIDAGILRIRTLLNWQMNQAGHMVKRPKLFYFDSCPNAIDQIEGLQYDVRRGVSTGKPVKVGDDCVDTTKYIVQSLRGFEHFDAPVAPENKPVGEKCLEQAQKKNRLKFSRGHRSKLRQTLIRQELERRAPEVPPDERHLIRP